MNKKLAELLFPNITEDITDLEAKYPPRSLKEHAMVTRFAPSPTGFLHMGSLYAAFVSYIFATRSNGVFFLRIEDTDQKRQVENGIQGIVNDLTNFDIYPQEKEETGNYAPYIQSQRTSIYHTFAKYLVQIGYAYPCFLTEEELDTLRKEQTQKKVRPGVYGSYAKSRNLSYETIQSNIALGMPYVLRFRSSGNFEQQKKWKDCIKGEVTISENDLDIVLLKSDGIPTYHFAHVVDDYLMHTTHVIRGDEWLSSVPIHLQLYEALNRKPPKYAHLAPLMKKEENRIRKLSKRYDKECSLAYYEEKGYPKEAIKLYLATLINAEFENWWNKEKQILDFPFQLSKMSVGGPLFDIEKLENISRTWISYQSAESLYEQTLQYTKKYDQEFHTLLKKEKDLAIKALSIERYIKKPRKDIACYQDVRGEIWYLFDELYFDEMDLGYTFYEKKYDLSLLRDYLHKAYKVRQTEQEWMEDLKEFATQHNYATTTKDYKENPQNYKGHIGDLCELIRVVITRKTTSPNIYELLNLLTKEQIEKRIDFFEKHYS